MEILIVADPLAALKATTDTSLYLAKAALQRGHKVYWATAESIQLTQSEVSFGAVALETRGATVVEGKPFHCKVSEVNAVWIRKDPPFNEAYVRLCWLLALMEGRTWFMNRPSLLLRYHEKLVPAEAVAQGFLAPEDIIENFYRSPEALAAFLKAKGASEAVAKPFFGYGGRDIRRLSAAELGSSATPETLLQPFHPEVQTQGDHRLFYLGGKFIGHVARMPKPGGFVSNFAQGGTGETHALTAAQAAVVDKLGKFLASVGIDFAGADLIGTHVSEVNITSPTGLVAMQKLDGTVYGDLVLDFVEAQSSAV